MDWDGDDGLRKMWDRYYMCPNPAYIQFLQATRDATIGLTPANTSCQDTHVFLDKVPNGGLVQGDKDATWAADVSHAEDITMLPAQHGCHADLQVALEYHLMFVTDKVSSQSGCDSSEAAHQEPFSEHGYNGRD